MTIRALTPLDAVDYRALMLEAYAAHPDAFTSSVAERAGLPLSWWEDRLRPGARAAEVVFGARADGVLMGVAGIAFNGREKQRHKATLFGMYVAERFSRQGLGRRLVDAVLDCARERAGVRVLQLTVTQDNARAADLYGSCGFVAFGVEPCAVAVDGGYVTKLHMWCDLGCGDANSGRREYR